MQFNFKRPISKIGKSSKVIKTLSESEAKILTALHYEQLKQARESK